MRFVGDPVALRGRRDRGSRPRTPPKPSSLDIETLPAVTNARDAAKPGAPQLYDDVPGNLCARLSIWRCRQGRGGVRRAPRMSRSFELRQQPPRDQSDGAARRPSADYDADKQHLTLQVGSQGVFGMRGAARRHARREARTGARADRQCRRLVRHEGRGLSGICLRAACGADCWASR